MSVLLCGLPVNEQNLDILRVAGTLGIGQIFASMVNLAKEPENDKYLAEQRLAFSVTAISVFYCDRQPESLENLRGLSCSGTVFWLAQIHNLFTVILFLSIIVHLLAFLIKANRPLVPSMFTGKIDMEYVRKRHSKWWEKLNSEVKGEAEEGEAR